jgi:hypothetical protein
MIYQHIYEIIGKNNNRGLIIFKNMTPVDALMRRIFSLISVMQSITRTLLDRTEEAACH